jgi:hypothetical protein
VSWSPGGGSLVVQFTGGRSEDRFLRQCTATGTVVLTGWDEAVSVFRASWDACLDGQPESTQVRHRSVH